MKLYLIVAFSIVCLFCPLTLFAQQDRPSVSVKFYQVPILRELEYNPIMRIKIESKDPMTIKALALDLSGSSDLKGIKTLGLYFSGADSVFRKNNPIAELSELNSDVVFKIKLKLKTEVSYIWISCALHHQADLLHKFSIEFEDISFKGNVEANIHIDGFKTPLRYGLALRQHGQDGVHTHRIPGLATTSRGTLCAIYDARRASSRDLQGDMDIGLNRSFDGGNTWDPMQIMMDMGEWGGLPQKFNGVSDANILVHGNDIYVAGLWMYGVINKDGLWLEGLNEESNDWNHQWRNMGSQPGFDEKQTSQFLIVKSSDDGEKWSEPINLTQMCKKEEWWLWAPAPGRGIVMDDGTLVFPTQGRDENGLPFSNITFSKDDGKTWQTSKAASHNTTENAVVENEPGKLMLNIRDNRNRTNKSESNGRAVFTTSDMGNIWEEHDTSHGTLIEPVCMGGLHKHVSVKNEIKKEVLLFSNPNSKYQRKNITIKMSFDGGKTWPEDSWILLDVGQGRGYSCVTSINNNTIGIVYEGSGADLVFQKIDISEYLK